MRAPASALLSVCLFACGDDAVVDPGADTCLDPLPRDCAIIWADYEAIHTRLLGATCGGAATGPSCHSADGAMGGLVLDDIDAAHAALLADGSDGNPRVIPGNPECSDLVKRLYSDREGYQMPPGSRLDDTELCSIVRWIADGAERGDVDDGNDDNDDNDAGS